MVQRGNNRDACFFCEDEYRYFLDRLREGQGRFGVALHAYVLMSNHVHLLMTPRDSAGISRLMQHLGFKVVFDAGWYVQLHGERDGGGAPLELAFMLPDHEFLSPALRRAFDGQGMFLTIEVDDVDTLYERLRGDGLAWKG